MRDDFGHKALVIARRDAERDVARRTRWCVFVWRGDGRYDIRDAIHVFKRRSAAGTFACDNTYLGYVARPIIVEEA